MAIRLIRGPVLAYNSVMGRYLAISLILLPSAGPSLCCCKLPLFGSRPAEVQSCCNAPADHKQTPCKGDCPCRVYREMPASFSKGTPVDLAPLFAGFVAWHVVFVALPGETVLFDTVGLPSPFLSAERLLHVHHRLRC